MKTFPSIAVALVCMSSALAQDVKPVWELGVNAIDPGLMKGKVEPVDGMVKLDGAASFAIPKEALGEQKDFTIEFEMRLPPGFQPMSRKEGSLSVVSNTDAREHAGFDLRYCPPGSGGGSDNVFLISVNGYETGKFRALAGNAFTRLTIVAKDRALMFYRDGMLWAMTGEFKPSSLPLSIGETLKTPLPLPYELRQLRIYDKALPPVDGLPDATVMRNVSGDQFSMQRVDITDPTLPRILVVGDSISGGYRTFVTEHFKGKANVDYWVGSGWFDWTAKEDDFPVLRGWNGVLANGPYDVVSWNSMTLHMWTPNKPERCDIGRYPDQMTRVVEHLQRVAPKTKFVWVHCTPYTKTEEGKPAVIDHEKSKRLVLFNEATDPIMRKFGIPIVDLYTLCERHPELALKDGLHWSGEASRLMAAEIVAEIEKHLPERTGAPESP